MSWRIGLSGNEAGSKVVQRQFQIAIDKYQQGDLPGAASSYRSILKIAEDHVEAFYNLGVVCFEQNQFAEAAANYAQAATLAPDDPDIWFNLGLALKAQGKLEAAVTCYESALELDPEDVDCLYNLGVVFNELRKFDEAVKSFRKVLAVRPDHPSALNNLGVVYHNLDQREEAIACFRRVAVLGHNTESAKHILAALTGATTHAPPTEYVRTLFDDFSERFDQCLLEELEYKTPELLSRLLLDLPTAPEFFNHVIDLGCGTGLSGMPFRAVAKRLTGVDLSTGMVMEAAKKGVYDQLEAADITSFLAESDEGYDLFVATDVFVYLGDLTKIFGEIQGKARPGSYFLFSTESYNKENFILRASGRYAHAKTYIETLAVEHGFIVEVCQREGIRKERGQWIMGDLFVLRLQSD